MKVYGRDSASWTIHILMFSSNAQQPAAGTAAVS
jgi:hypothetical protein